MSFDFVLLSNNTGNSSADTSFLANENSNNAETAGSIALFTGNKDNQSCGFDAFGGKDIFGTADFSNMDENLCANAANTETAGSLACADFASMSTSGFSSSSNSDSSDCSGASASAGGDCGGGAASCSSGGGSFSSVC